MLIRIQIEVVFHFEMDINTYSDDNASCHKEDEVAQEHDIFEHTITAIHFDGNYFLNQKHKNR